MHLALKIRYIISFSFEKRVAVFDHIPIVTNYKYHQQNAMWISFKNRLFTFLSNASNVPPPPHYSRFHSNQHKSIREHMKIFKHSTNTLIERCARALWFSHSLTHHHQHILHSSVRVIHIPKKKKIISISWFFV